MQSKLPIRPGPVVQDYRSLLLSSSALIDVRAPVEFAAGAIPGAVNLPLLSDKQRQLVGIRYKEEGQQRAIELGAELVSPRLRQQRIAAWVEYATTHPDCVLYCFRGGLRSRICQQWLLDAGVEVPLVTGGYKALRRFLINTLDSLCAMLPIILIGGRTGIGKTHLLQQLESTIDLEKLAHHRGSSFGGLIENQPANADFENAVSIELLKLHSKGSSSIFLEDEARLIGRVCLPDVLRKAMQAAPIYILECDLAQRIDNCFKDYVTDLLQRYVLLFGETDGFNAFAEHHRNGLWRIRKRLGGTNYNYALSILDRALHQHREHDDTSEYRRGIELLLCKYYDPMYDYQLSSKTHRIVFEGTASQIIAKGNLDYS